MILTSFAVKHLVKVKGEKCQCHVIVMILIIHVGEHGSQNTIVHVKKPTFYPYTKIYTEKINNKQWKSHRISALALAHQHPWRRKTQRRTESVCKK